MLFRSNLHGDGDDDGGDANNHGKTKTARKYTLPKTHGKCPVLHTCTQPIHITRALAAGFLPAAPCFLWSCRLRGLFAFASLAGKAR